MANNTLDAKQHARELLDHLGPSQIEAVVRLLEVMTSDEDDKLTAEDQRAVSFSREYFEQGGEGISLDQIAADCGLTMDQIRKP
jgi:hypothetical protein